MRFHLLSLHHTETISEYIACAYTGKVIRFAKMMTDQGHEVFLYSGEHNEAQATEHIQVISRLEQDSILGPHIVNKTYDPDWFGPAWKLGNARSIAALTERLQPHDFICASAGRAHQEVCDAFPNHISVETGIGYEGTFAKFRVFESYAWLHHLAGLQHNDNVSWYDTVIPNYYDPSEFPLGTHDGNYLLWMGRFIERKGPHIAYQIAQAAQKKLMMAGQGVHWMEDGSVRGEDGTTITGDGFEHVGPVNSAERATLMGNAQAMIVPTTYLGPFEGVAVEAMLCGTPIITTDWGAFTEYNIEGKTGYRFRTLGEALAAISASPSLDHREIQRYAQANFSMKRVGELYSAYFAALLDLWGDGWTSPRSIPGRYRRQLL